MKLYHSSNVRVEHPDTKHSRSYLDFGRGFISLLFTNRQNDMSNASREEDNLHGSILMNLPVMKRFGI